MRFISSIRGSRPLKFVVSICVVSGVAVLASCGGGSDTPVAPPAPSVTSAVAGEVLAFTADTDSNPKTYSWTTLVSAYGAEGSTGGGTLSDIGPGGRYTMTDSGGDLAGNFFKSVDGTMSVGRLALPALNGTNRAFASDASLVFGTLGDFPNLVTVPVLSLSSPMTVLSEIAGTYNFISLSCSGPSKGFFNQSIRTGTQTIWNDGFDTLVDHALCRTNYGTVRIGTDGIFTACPQGNLSAVTCIGSALTSANEITLDGGAWKYDDGSAVHTAAFQATGAGKVGWIDTNGGSLGYGQITLSEQKALSPSVDAGSFVIGSKYKIESVGVTDFTLVGAANNNVGTEFTATGSGTGTGTALAAVSGAFGTYKADTSGFNSVEHTVCAGTNFNEIQVDGSSGSTFTVDIPWAGFIVPSVLSANTTPYGDSTFPALAMVAGSGAYVSRNMGGYGPALEPWAFELGLRYSTGGCPP